LSAKCLTIQSLSVAAFTKEKRDGMTLGPVQRFRNGTRWASLFAPRIGISRYLSPSLGCEPALSNLESKCEIDGAKRPDHGMRPGFLSDLASMARVPPSRSIPPQNVGFLGFFCGFLAVSAVDRRARCTRFPFLRTPECINPSILESGRAPWHISI
jgi:hypothetical protein